MPTMRILDSSGDTVVEWNRRDEASVDRARRVFCQLHAERRLAFLVPPGGGPRDTIQLDEFDPAAEGEIVWVRPVQGG